MKSKYRTRIWTGKKEYSERKYYVGQVCLPNGCTIPITDEYWDRELAEKAWSEVDDEEIDSKIAMYKDRSSLRRKNAKDSL